MTADINQLLLQLRLYIGVPLTPVERRVADDLYEQITVWCKEELARDTLLRKGVTFEDDEDSTREAVDHT